MEAEVALVADAEDQMGVGMAATPNPTPTSPATTAIATGDKVNFLLVQNQSSTASVYIVVDGGTASSTAGDAFLIGASQTWYGRLPNATVDDIHAISSTGTVNCVVAALLDDVG